ncbi:MAG: hypothetical protein ACE5GO_03465 [Anaerolineales bacterium]
MTYFLTVVDFCPICTQAIHFLVTLVALVVQADNRLSARGCERVMV